MPTDWHLTLRFLMCFIFLGALPCSIGSSSSSSPVNPKTAMKHPSKVLLISLDGFRHDYLELARSAHVDISAFERIWREGFRALRVDNEFVTRTGPNHFSLVTGLHEESHGLVDNTFFDPQLNESFDMADSRQSGQPRWFNVGSEPIWVTNQRHGHRSAVTVWPGSMAPIKGMLPSERYAKFDRNTTLRHSIDWMIERLGRENVTLGLIYHPEPDAQGHKTGPYSVELLQVIASLNKDIAYLLKQLDSTPVLQSNVNIILTSDHGMAEVNERQAIVLDHFINQSMYISPGREYRVVWALWPQTGFTVDDLYTRLANAHAKMRVYRRADIPSRFHYSNHWRIAPLLVYAEPGWLIVASNATLSNWSRRGEHGYDNQWSDMSPFFLAMGPGFRQQSGNRTIERIKLVDVYPMMCHLLGLHSPAPHNGSLDRVLDLLNPDPYRTATWFVGTVDRFSVSIVFLLTLLVALALTLSGCFTLRCLRVQTMRYQRRERLKKQLQHTPGNQSIRMLPLTTLSGSRSSGRTKADGSRHLLQNGDICSDDESDEIDMLAGRPNREDDMAWINMLHGPKSRYP